jgi:hypothetical protein
METASRAPRRSALALTSLLLAALALTGCGGGDGAAATPRTEPSAEAEFQTVEVDKHGISYEIPEGWELLTSDKLLDADNPAVKQFAERLGQEPAQVAAMLNQSIDTMAVTDEGMDHGFVENVNSTGNPGMQFDEDQIKLQLISVGAKDVAMSLVETEVGEVIRAEYTNGVGPNEAHGVMLGIDVGEDFMAVTVTAYSAEDANARADQIQESLERIG